MSPTEYQQLTEFLGRQFGEIDRRFAEADRRLAEMDHRFSARFDAIDERFREVFGHFDETYCRLERLSPRGLQARIVELEQRIRE